LGKKLIKINQSQTSATISVECTMLVNAAASGGADEKNGACPVDRTAN